MRVKAGQGALGHGTRHRSLMSQGCRAASYLKRPFSGKTRVPRPAETRAAHLFTRSTEMELDDVVGHKVESSVPKLLGEAAGTRPARTHAFRANATHHGFHAGRQTTPRAANSRRSGTTRAAPWDTTSDAYVPRQQGCVRWERPLKLKTRDYKEPKTYTLLLYAQNNGAEPGEV